MFLFSENQQEILGAFTSRNNKNGGRFGTDIIKGNTVIVEYYEPQTVQGKGKISIFRDRNGNHRFCKHAFHHFGGPATSPQLRRT